VAIRVEDGRDPRLADYAGVRDPALLVTRGLLIAEGRFVVRRLLQSRRIVCRSLLLNEAAFNAFEDVMPSLPADVDVFVATPDAITAATGFNMHRGCLALAERPASTPMDVLLTTARVVVVLERVVDPDNIGAVFRCAEAFGADAVLVSAGCADPFYRKAIRTSSGAALVVPFASAEPWPDVLDTLRAAGFIVVATTPDVSAVEIGEFVGSPRVRERIAVVLGTEGKGLTPAALARADVRVRIPMAGALDSLNVGTTAGIVLHRIKDAQHAD
jgi:tRNA G18 (ribose-2'-O)-methylase SpoU